MKYPGWDSSWLVADVKHRDIHTCISHLAPPRVHRDLFKTFCVWARWSMSNSVCFSPPPQCQMSPVVTKSDVDIYIQPIPSLAGACQGWSGWMLASLLKLAGPTNLLSLHTMCCYSREGEQPFPTHSLCSLLLVPEGRWHICISPQSHLVEMQ